MNIVLDKNWNEIKNRSVKSVWNLYHNQYESLGMEYGDFENLAYIMLQKELKKFNANKSNIHTYAVRILKKRMCDYIRNNFATDKTKANYHPKSLNVPVSDDSETELKDTLVDPSTLYTPDNNIDKIKRFYRTLSNKQKDILFLKTIGLSSSEIQEVLDISSDEFTGNMRKIQTPRRVSILRKEVQ